MRVRVSMRAATPEGKLLRGPGVASFFRPGKDPEHVLADRVPDREVPLPFSEVARGHQAEVSTAGWTPGAWTVQTKVLDDGGTPVGWAWYTLPLDP